MAVPSEVEALLAAERAEWGKWRAKTAIFIDGVRAFSPGHAVPTSHVEKFDLQDQVEPADAPPDAPTVVPSAPQGADIPIVSTEKG